MYVKRSFSWLVEVACYACCCGCVRAMKFSICHNGDLVGTISNKMPEDSSIDMKSIPFFFTS